MITKNWKLRLALVVALALIPATIAHASGGSDTLRLSMAQALSIGIEQSVSVQSAELDVTKARYDQKGNLGHLLPQINATGSYSYMLKKQRMYFGGGDSPMASMFPEEGIEVGQTHSINGGISAQLPLIAPQLWASLGLDKVAVESAIEKARASRVSLTAEISKAYMAALLARESRRVLEQSLANMQSNYANIKQKYERGLVAEYDLIRMDAQVKNLMPDVIRSAQAVRLAEMKLLVLMNLDPELPLILTESLSDYKDTVYGDMLADTKTLPSLADNTALRSLDLTGKQLSEALHAKRMAFLPTLALNFSYSYSYANDQLALSNSRRWSPFSTIGVALTVPLFSGGTRYYGVQSTKVQIQQIALQRTQAERELNLGVSNTLSERRNASEHFIASQEAVRSASKGLEIAQVMYRTGKSTILELNDAELALRQANLNLNQSIYNYMVATFNLHQLEGKVFTPEQHK